MIYFSGWWLTYPSEKYDFDGCSLRMMRWNNCTELGDWGESLCVSLSSMCLQNLEPTKNSRSILRGYVFPICFFLEFVWVDFWHDTSWYVWFRLAGFKAHDRVWQVHFNWQEEVEWCGCPPKHVAPQQEHLPLQVVASEGDVSSFNHAVLRVEFFLMPMHTMHSVW